MYLDSTEQNLSCWLLLYRKQYFGPMISPKQGWPEANMVSRACGHSLSLARLAESGVVKPEVFFDASAKLFGYGYYFTGQNANIIRHAGIIAEWKIDRWPFSQTLSTFADEDLDLMQVLQLAGGFIRLLYQESLLPESRNTIMVKILENIAKKEGGVQGVRYLLGALPAIFGVNVIGLARATETISLWLKEISNRPFRL